MSNATPVTVTPEELQAQLTKLQEANAERDRKIQELTAEKATLEARATSVQQPVIPVQDPTLSDSAIEARTAKIMEDMAIDPAKASKDLAQLIKSVSSSSADMAANRVASNIQPTIENEKFAEKVRQDNKDLLAISPAMEDIIANEANMIVRALPRDKQTFQEFQKAVTKVVKDKRESLKDLLKKTEEPKVELPAGAKAENGTGGFGGGAKPVAAAPTEDKTSPDGRKAIASSKGLF